MTAESPALELVFPSLVEADEWARFANGLRSRSENAEHRQSARRCLVLLPPSSGRSWALGRRDARREIERAIDADPSHASAVGGRRLLVISSMRATGATERTAGFAEESQATPSADAEAQQWRTYEDEVVECAKARGDWEVCILRCCWVEGVDDPATRLLDGPWVKSWLGFDPPIQVLPQDRLLDALGSLANSSDELPGVLHVAPDDAVPLSRWLRGRPRRRLPIPGWLHRLSARRRGERFEVRRLLQRPATLDNRRLLQTLGVESLGRMNEKGAATDGFGWKQDVVDRLGRWCLEPLRRWYWRVSDTGTSAVPGEGPALLVGIHRGYMPLDAMMILHLVRRRTGRTVRFLIHPALLRWPFMATLFPALGGLVASASSGERILSSGGILGVFPEGANAAMAATKDAYPLRPFLSDEFARWAIRWNAPVIPVALVGPAEALPIFRRVRWRWWRRHSGWPTLPLGFLFPFGPPIPLPSKWHILFLEPIAPEEFEHDDEVERARALAQAVRTRLDEAVRELVDRRRSIWFGGLEPGE